jgi:iron complex outermembrane receptor protein
MHRKYRRDSKPNQNSCLAPAATSIGAAVFLALYGLPRCATAQQATTTATELEEVTVTATRRSETLESVPYAISVVGAQALETGDIIDIASLAEQVPGLSTFNYGARLVASTVPIIRGINASGTPRGFRSFEQAPVGTYVGNSPIDGYFQLYDIQRVEVLRGPQGTLYGAGALGGALRFIPNSPELNQFSASVEASGGKVTHSSEPAYTYSGLVNVPIGDTLAFRASGKYASEPGWISAYGLFTRNEDNQFGVPVLANPSDPVNSSPIYHSVSDWNWEKTATARASLLWKPNEAFSLEAADLYSNLWGTGGPQVNFQFPGGVSPIDPTHTLPAGGHYQEFTQVDQPYHRTTNLASLDLSYDAGFATLSATSSYITGNAITQEDQTYNLLGVGGGFYVQYYSGVPQNPRFVYTQSFADNTFVFSQEVRLVSKTGPDKMFDYVVGVFYEDSHREGIWNVVNPGSPERSVSQGCTSAVFAGSSFPNCLLVSGPKDLIFIQDDQQTFVDKSVFGELTWHFLQHGAITGGVRHFSQQFTDAQLYLDYTFPTYIPPTPHQSPASKTVGKVDVSYEYTTGQYVYALWSQGFRRGGANSVPYSGFF